MNLGVGIGAVAVAVALSACQEMRTDSAPPVGAATPTATTTPAIAIPSPSAPQVPEADPAWLPPPWTLQSTTRAAPVGAVQPEYLFCGWRVPPSRVINGDRTAVTEQVLVHPEGMRARLLKYESDIPGGVGNLVRHVGSSCMDAGKAEFYGGRILWIYRGVAGGTDMGCVSAFPSTVAAGASPLSCAPGSPPVTDAQIMHVVAVSGVSAERAPTVADAAALLSAWAKLDLASR